MDPSLALFLCTVFVIFMLRWDPAKTTSVSSALWVPIVWMLILSARLPSQWFGFLGNSAQDAYTEGNTFDRVIYLALILLAVRTVMNRSLKLSDLLKENMMLTVLLLLGLASVLWSDFPFVAFRRWFRDLGGFLMIAVVASEKDPLDSFSTLLRRVSYVLIPYSVLLIKYFPGYGRGYEAWTGQTVYLGVTLNKNTLGVVCLLSGLFFFWDILRRWPSRKEKATRRILLVDLFFIGQTLWLLNLAHSSTSTVCLAIASLIVAAGHLNIVRRSPSILIVGIPATIAAYLTLDFLFDIAAAATRFVGRDPTFTTRTDLWNYLDNMDLNWLLGAGYESFWLGPRLQEIWSRFTYLPNQAHNGYKEMFLNLGALGVCVLSAFLIARYRRTCLKLKNHYGHALLGLALIIALLLYNVTEAAFKIAHPLWFAFLLANITLPVGNEKLAFAFKPSRIDVQAKRGKGLARAHTYR